MSQSEYVYVSADDTVTKDSVKMPEIKSDIPPSDTVVDSVPEGLSTPALTSVIVPSVASDSELVKHLSPSASPDISVLRDTENESSTNTSTDSTLTQTTSQQITIESDDTNGLVDKSITFSIITSNSDASDSVGEKTKNSSSGFGLDNSDVDVVTATVEDEVMASVQAQNQAVDVPAKALSDTAEPRPAASLSHTEPMGEITQDGDETQQRNLTDVDGQRTAGMSAETPRVPSPLPSPPCAGPPAPSPTDSLYHVKRITFGGKPVAVVTQNDNGPCPLLAIANVLLLQGRISLAPPLAVVTAGQLMERLADCLFQQPTDDIAAHNQLDYEQNRHDALAIFHKLQTGLDVNVKFTGVGDFEYTPECLVFDLLGLRLRHGWLVDPESPTDVAAVGNSNYNQLVEKIIEQKHSSREELSMQALIAEEFLVRTAAQLTYHGLSELSSLMKEEELCVFFRNNHFCPLYRRKGELFLLVTDQGFLSEGRVVWEVLANVEGDGCFVDADFHTYVKPFAEAVVSSESLTFDQQIDQDYLVALSLQQEQEQVSPPRQVESGSVDANPYLSDHQLALRMQEEEDSQAGGAGGGGGGSRGRGGGGQLTGVPSHPRSPPRLAPAAPPATATPTSGSQRREKSDCTIL